MRNIWNSIPAALRKQILLRYAVGIIGVFLLISAIAFGSDWRFVIPCLVLAFASSIGGTKLLRRAISGNYLVIEGVCVEVEKTRLRSKIRSVVIKVDDRLLKVQVLKQRMRFIVGDILRIYLLENTPVYDMDGCMVVNTCITMEKEKWIDASEF